MLLLFCPKLSGHWVIDLTFQFDSMCDFKYVRQQTVFLDLQLAMYSKTLVSIFRLCILYSAYSQQNDLKTLHK